MQIYIEIRIRAEMEELWRLTQTPDLHADWDLRFSSITYLPQTSEGAQRFRYATRLGGIEVAGWGETAGERSNDTKRSSALRFGSDDRLALIQEGSGYWKYEQTEDGIRFITGYDYEVRWGILGRLIDRLVFRRLIGWATAWSFDRLRLWIESGVNPRQAARQALVHGLGTATLAGVWLWHGLVPKLLWPAEDEMAMLAQAGVAAKQILPLLGGIGALEVLAGLLVLTFSRRRWPFLLTILLMLAATAGVLVTSPQYAFAAFNPITLNLFMIATATIVLLSQRDLPSARCCLRRAPKKVQDG
jgi:hypothetical protein